MEEFLRLACLDYRGWDPAGADEAERILARDPAIAQTGIHAAAAAGEVAAATARLDAQPELLDAPGRPHGWVPLLYACYSRVKSAGSGRSTLAVARLLLSRGADPDAGFLLDHEVPPFTALTGAFGNGEDGSRQPPHPDALALARLLLEAGADPNDGQALYNRHFHENDDHLRLLLAYGLGRERKGRWARQLGDRLECPAQLLTEELWSAARKNFLGRVKLLVAHGTNLDAKSRRDGRTPYEAALRAGNLQIAELLLEHGALRTEPAPEERFAAACLAGRREEVMRLLAQQPTLLDALGFHGRVELLHRAVEGNHPEGLRLMSALGFEISGMTTHDGVGVNLLATPLHNAAWLGNLELVNLLLELGADPRVQEPTYGATPLGWAEHNGQVAVVDLLKRFHKTIS
ncbi:MAG: ankyrin repeat domain-containing protein [Thermoanaerobaculia bacterium]